MSPESREFLLGVMSRTRTGVGLPDGRRFAIAVFTNSSETSTSDRDRAM